MGTGGLLARHTNNIQAGTSANTYYAWDGLGNAAQTLDGSGNVTNTFAWDAYGKGVSTSATSDPYAGFGGQWGYYTDSETGMTLCGARFYDSNAGRWLTRDPIGYAGGINLYGYVGGNPLSSFDPSGLRPVDPFDDSPEADADYTSDLNAGPHPGLSGGIKMTGYLLGMIPGWGLVPGLTGRDFMGCEISTSQQEMEFVTGALGMAGQLGSLGELGGEAVGAGAGVIEESTASGAQLSRFAAHSSLPPWLINAANDEGYITIGRGLNPGETFGPGGITPSGWSAVHVTTDLKLAQEIADIRGTTLATARIHSSSLEQLIGEGKIAIGDLMRELRLFNQHLPEIAGHLR